MEVSAIYLSFDRDRLLFAVSKASVSDDLTLEVEEMESAKRIYSIYSDETIF